MQVDQGIGVRLSMCMELATCVVVALAALPLYQAAGMTFYLLYLAANTVEGVCSRALFTPREWLTRLSLGKGIMKAAIVLSFFIRVFFEPVLLVCLSRA